MRWLAVLVVILVSATARAHVAPSVEVNNHYLKVTPGAGRVRLAYTVFFGEVPGAQARRLIDTDRDGEISDVEAQVFGDKLARDVAPAVELAIDGAREPITWASVSVGLGQPVTKAGAFSVDLIAVRCLSARGTHHVSIRDRFAIPRPGETELLVEETPGVTIEQVQIAGRDVKDSGYLFEGPGGPLAEHGVQVRFTIGAQAPLASGAECTAPTPGSSGATIWIGGGLAGVVLAGTTMFAIRRRYSRQAPV
ncbi:MAG: hypothetical protein AB7P03_29390 [Kofleriaceae bacterium]